jgi:GNAT superfamily N-acetyltransferase
MTVDVIEVSSKKLLTSFIDFPHDLYKDDPNYVPELFIAQRDMLTPGKHPFHNHSQVQLYLAMRKGQVVGRVAAIFNKNHNEFVQAKDGFFGFFDAINDQDVANALLSTAEKWLKAKGAATLIGPVSFSTNEVIGVLSEGFDEPPVIMMPYNKRYYITLLENYKLTKHIGLIAYNILTYDHDDKAQRAVSVLTERLKSKGITIRKINMKDFKNEVDRIKVVYNEAWAENVGFVPMTDDEFKHMAKDMKMIINTDVVLVAEKDGQVIGFSLAVPNLNEVFIKIKRGRLFPTGLFKLLWNKNKVKSVRIIALGVLKEYRRMGIEGVFYGLIMNAAEKNGWDRGEGSWILEDNVPMNLGLQKMKGIPYKRYRIYRKMI